MEGRLLSGSDDGLVCYWDLKGAGQTVEATQKFGEPWAPADGGGIYAYFALFGEQIVRGDIIKTQARGMCSVM